MDFKSLRSDKLKLTQEEFANLYGISIQEVQELDKTGKPDMDLIVKIATKSGLDFNTILSYEKPRVKPISAKDTWEKTNFTKKSLSGYLNSALEQMDIPDDMQKNYIDDLEIGIMSKFVKPTVAIVGRSDTGKSTLINSLIGAEKMPAKWTPTTSTAVYVKHIKDRPAFIHDEAWIFKRECGNEKFWNSKRLYDEKYCEKWKVAGGDLSLLETYSTRQGGGLKTEAGSAVVFVDAPILLNCDIIDLPGYGTETASDDVITAKTAAHADVLIYLSLASGFLRIEDIEYLKNNVRTLPVLEKKGENAERERIANKVAEGLAKDSEYTGARNDAVKLAWDYEKADVEMGGRGSSDWDDAQCQEIKETGKVRGAEGHHQKNVADHPEDQGDPDNIKFYKSRKEHLEKGHNGDFHNSSDAPKIDKDKMLKKTNSKRVFRNEIKGIGIAAAIGIGVGFTIGFAVSLAQTGVTPDSIKYALINGGKSGLSSGIQSTIGYGIGRTVGQLASQALTGVFSNVGLEITENIAKMCNMGAVGAITIGVFSTVQFVKLVCKGESLKTAAIQVGKQALFSLSLLVVSITAQGIFGGPSGIIVSVGVGIIFVTYTIADTVHQRNYSEKLRVYMIEKCKPIFA